MAETKLQKMRRRVPGSRRRLHGSHPGQYKYEYK